MTTVASALTLGVEEEFFIVDAETRALRPRAERVLEAACRELEGQVELEINLAQIETATPVCSSLDDLERQLCRLRSGLHRAARAHSSEIAPIGTHPFSPWLGQQLAPKERYSMLEHEVQRIAWEQVICGCHVHVGIDDRDLAVRVMDHIRPWLPTLRAMTANSPYWEGVDTGYASYRMTIFDRWPVSGPPPLLGSDAAYNALLRDLIDTGAAHDEQSLYWDVRPSRRFATLEIRVADVLPTVDEAVLLAGIVRALVLTAMPHAASDAPPLDIPEPVLRGARWRAARFGLRGELVDVERRTTCPAREAVGGLLSFLRPALVAVGDLERVEESIARLLTDGTGAERQRRAFDRGGSKGIVDAMVAGSRKAAGVPPTTASL